MVGEDPLLTPPWRWLLGVAALPNLVLAAGFAFQQPWATGLWPWETGRLSHLFLGAMLAAIAAGAGWAAVSGEVASLPAGFLNLTVTLTGIAAYLLFSVPEHRGLGLAVGVSALANVGLLLASWRLPAPRGPTVPGLVRASYAVFSVVLVGVGLALIVGIDGVMPWPVDPPTSVVFGWIFLGDAFYFAYALWRPYWDGARAQLWSFLGYDLVLLGPLLAHLNAVDAALLPNLLLYLAVGVYSAVLGLYFLVVNPATRGWAGRQPVTLSKARNSSM